MSEDNIEEMNADPRMCIEAADNIIMGFNWSETEEGSQFWKRVYNRLQEIAYKTVDRSAREAEEANEERG